MATTPLRVLTEKMLTAVNQLDYETLRSLVDDDYGIVDVDPEGNSFVIEDMAAWEGYMQQQMEAMRQMQAELSSEILDYQETVGPELGYSVVRFRQDVGLPQQQLHHYCVATIIWKRHGDTWKEARWHCSLERKEAGDAS